MHRFVTSLFKILLASLLAGSLLSFLGITTDSLLHLFGWTPQEIVTALHEVLAWASPRVMLGAMIVLPVWLVTYIMMPPGDG